MLRLYEEKSLGSNLEKKKLFTKLESERFPHAVWFSSAPYCCHLFFSPNKITWVDKNGGGVCCWQMQKLKKPAFFFCLELLYNPKIHYKAMPWIHTLTGVATLLGTPCKYRVGPPFAFRTALILRDIDSTRCWKHPLEILVHIDMITSRSCCRFVSCTSMMWISHSTTSQRCSIGLRSGDCGGHLSKVNSLSCSRNPSEMIWALWHGALSCWK